MANDTKLLNEAYSQSKGTRIAGGKITDLTPQDPSGFDWGAFLLKANNVCVKFDALKQEFADAINDPNSYKGSWYTKIHPRMYAKTNHYRGDLTPPMIRNWAKKIIEKQNSGVK